MDEIKISIFKWISLLRALKNKGGSKSESGAFLLGKLGTKKVCHYICYDDLDENALKKGIITLDKITWVRLWKFCSQNKLQVLADIHTHPSKWTGQSPSDMQYPIVSQVGHLALIAPYYAKYWWHGLHGVGIYEYKGNYKWKQWPSTSGKVRLVLS